MDRNKQFMAAGAVTVLSVMAAGFWLVTANKSDDTFSSCRASAIAGGAGSIGGPLSLIDETGLAVTDAEIFTRPALVYFGYTYCPDVCPLDVARNAEAIDILQADGFDIRPVFISIDPERDTPEVLAEYTDYLHEDMLGLTGTPAQIKAASLAYKTYFKRQDGDDFYLMDHSTFSYLVLPGFGVEEFFRREASAEQIAETAACYLNASG